jgi:hypothetical protein
VKLEVKLRGIQETPLPQKEITKVPATLVWD